MLSTAPAIDLRSRPIRSNGTAFSDPDGWNPTAPVKRPSAGSATCADGQAHEGPKRADHGAPAVGFGRSNTSGWFLVDRRWPIPRCDWNWAVWVVLLEVRSRSIDPSYEVWSVIVLPNSALFGPMDGVITEPRRSVGRCYRGSVLLGRHLRLMNASRSSEEPRQQKERGSGASLRSLTQEVAEAANLQAICPTCSPRNQKQAQIRTFLPGGLGDRTSEK